MSFEMNKTMVGNISILDIVVGLITYIVRLVICVLNYPIYSYIKSKD